MSLKRKRVTDELEVVCLDSDSDEENTVKKTKSYSDGVVKNPNALQTNTNNSVPVALLSDAIPGPSCQYDYALEKNVSGKSSNPASASISKVAVMSMISFEQQEQATNKAREMRCAIVSAIHALLLDLANCLVESLTPSDIEVSYEKERILDWLFRHQNFGFRVI